MIGLANVIETRRGGRKPAAVFVQLVASPRAVNCFLDPWGVCHVEVGSGDILTDLDLRPLIGLWVIVYDLAEDPKRHAALCKLIAAAKPARLQMAVRLDNAWLVHSLADGETTTHTLTGEDAEAIAKGASRCAT